MTNGEAVELLETLAEQASQTALTATWALAFVTHGGEPTWDAFKSVTSAADQLAATALKVGMMRDHYEEVIP